MKEIGLIGIARIIVIACQLINVKMSTHYLSVKQLGLYFFLLTISYFANALIFGPIDYYQQANLGRVVKETDGIKPLVSFNLKLIGFYLLATIIVTVMAGLIAPRFLFQIILSAMLAVSLYSAQALRNILNNLGHKNVVSINLIQEAVLKIAAFLLLIKFFHPDELLLISAWVITLVVSTATLSWEIRKRGLFSTRGNGTIKAKDVFHFSYPISVSAVASWIQLQGYRLILIPLGLSETVGIYATVTSIGSAGMAAGATIFSQAFSPNLYKSSGKSTGVYLRNAILLIAAILLGTIVFGKLIIMLTTRKIFEPYWIVMLFGVLADASNLIIGGLAIHITLTSNTKKIMNSSFLGVIALLACFSILFFTKKINVYTIGIPLIMSQLVVIAYMYWDFRKCKT